MGKKKIDPKERVGIISYNLHGYKMVIEDYITPIDIWVKFTYTNERIHTTWQSFKARTVRSSYDKTIYGVGYIGIGDYKVTENGKYTRQYNAWSSMMQRCYSKAHLKRQSSYIGCKVAEEWHNFQNFAKWYDENYYEANGERMHLDKDILTKGNKVYSPETCIFAPHFINCLFIRSRSRRGDLPIGVYFCDKNLINKYGCQCSSEFGKQTKLGYYSTPEEAFRVYKTFKEKVIKNIALKYQQTIPEKLYNALIKYEVKIED
ncbi:hypothetical protein AF332_12020 [Sporosarcina globispora]|uniref:AP2 domain-containing protein n=1 Tax=Sporosarcina globispora TaxID=1459 RepID=A0A0M0GD94_SPOGL|nr:hypothetical protein [Sporosarcina globispora]KON87482.1 hypothetical protein AF332_12020 [Sporosarcina globispora]